MRVLVTGGAGYIGSHTTLALLQAGHDVLVVDDLSNSSPESLRRVADLSGRTPEFVLANVRDEAALDGAFTSFAPDAVIHFAGWKAVGESTRIPLTYYRENLESTITLLEVMAKHGVQTIVFSSSATVYGDLSEPPFFEDAPTGATNPYGQTKHMIERILADVSAADSDLAVAVLRYFNPIGAHESGRIGEDPRGEPNNLMPYVAQVAVGRREYLNVWGNDYPTHDGTGVRDYIHVVDLAQGHLKALEALDRLQCIEVNLGTGVGYSVLDVVKAFEVASDQPVSFRIGPRRPGDVAACYADPQLAMQLLGWKAERDLAAMCQDHWRWQKNNPQGYE